MAAADANKGSRKPSGRRKVLTAAVDVVLFGVAIWVLHRVLTQYRLSDILSAVGRIGAGLIGLSVLLTVLGYAALVGYDYLSLRLVGKPVPLRRMWTPSFISFAVANSAPIAILTGGGVRYRLFTGIGLTPGETAAVAATNVLTYVLGLFTVAGLAFLIRPIPIPHGMHLPVSSLRPVGIGFLVFVIAVLAAGGRTLRIRKKRIVLPPIRLLATQVAVSSADWILSSGALYVLLLAAGPVSYSSFLSAFLLAQIVTQVVPLPGGIGVFEAVILLLRPPGTEAPLVTGALLLYRVVYYLLPLIAAATLLVRRGGEGETGDTLKRVTRVVAPHLFAVLTFVGGMAMLVSGALPTDPARLERLGPTLQLLVIEGTSFFGSIVGIGLVLLAFGLERRVRGAWRLTVVLLVFGILLAGAGLDFRTAGLLLVLTGVLLPARKAFNRHTPLSAEPFTPGWIVAVLLALGSVVWLGFFSQQHAEYAAQPWWRFTLEEHGPRLLRAGVGVGVTLLAVVSARLIGGARRLSGRRRR